MNVHERLGHVAVVPDNSIAIELPVVKKGNKTSVCYNGILSNSGAEKVYLHYGFDGWRNTETVPMYKSNHGSYSTEVKVDGKEVLNFCFTDNANNWDNNNGSNWTVGIDS
ncbi:MAG: carbohydrate-binding protein [Clostridiaceae bacterium]|nr:carbohydrate-binding protein [Clostridiaceae bacterium]